MILLFSTPRLGGKEILRLLPQSDRISKSETSIQWILDFLGMAVGRVVASGSF